MTEAAQHGTKLGSLAPWRRLLWIGVSGLTLVGISVLAIPRSRPSPPQAAATSEPKVEGASRAGGREGSVSVTAQVARTEFHPWPPSPVVIGPPQGSPPVASVSRQVKASDLATDLLTKSPTSGTVRADAAPPSGEDLKQESLRYG